MRHERVRKLTEGEENRERELVVAVAELAGQQREAGCGQERTEPVLRPPRPRNQPGAEERPGDADDRQHAGEVSDARLSIWT